MGTISSMKQQHARLTATVMRDPRRAGKRAGEETSYVELNRLEPFHKQRFVAKVDCSTDLPADALGEAVALAMQRVWSAGFDPVSDNLVVVVSFEAVDGPLNGEPAEKQDDHPIVE